jgi:hypothetical protein
MEVNRKTVREFKTSKNPNAKKRKDEVMNLTILMQDGKNVVNLYKEHDEALYVMVVFLVIRRKTADLVA